MTRIEARRAQAEASEVYRREWRAAQSAPTLAEACRLAQAAEDKRIAAWQAAERAVHEA